MSLTTHERYVGYPAILAGGSTINHVRSITPNFGLNKMAIIPDGSVDQALIVEAYRQQKVQLVSGDLGAILSAISPITGLALPASAGTSLFQLQQRADGGTFASGSSHFTLTSPKGFAQVDEISATQDAKEGAQISLTYWGETDGTNPPFSLLSGQALSGSVAVNGLYRLASVTYEGTKLVGVQSVSFKTGIQYGSKRQSGALYADVGSILERRPTIEVRGTNLTLMAEVGAGLGAISTGLVIYFEKIGASGANHVSVTFAGGTYLVNSLSQSGTQDAEGTILADMAGGTIAFSITATLP